MSEEETIEKEQPQVQEQNNTEDEAPDEKNWKAFREERKKDREARQRAEQEAIKRKKEAEALKQAMDAILDKKTPVSQADDEYEDQSASDQDRIRKEMERILDERDRKKEKERMERERAEMPKKLRSEYPDFDKVVNEENLDYLDYKYPHIAQAYYHMPDSPEKWKAVYKSIKQFVPSTEKDDKKLEENMKKPKSMASGIANTGDSAPVVLDDKRKQDNWARMQKIMKTVG